MPYTPTNNPYAVGDPYMYDLKWVIRKIHEWTDPLDSAAAAKNSATEAAASALSAQNNAESSANSAESAANSARSAGTLIIPIAEKLNVQSRQLDVLDGRMDSFSRLAAGSTTGDAELIDIRIGANGTTYPTAGDAVRGQVTDLSNEIDDIKDSISSIEYEAIQGTLYSNKQAQKNQGTKVRLQNGQNYNVLLITDFSGIDGNLQIHCTAGNDAVYSVGFFFTDANDTIISQYNTGSSSANVTVENVSIPTGAQKLYVNGYNMRPVVNKYVEVPDFYTKEESANLFTSKSTFNQLASAVANPAVLSSYTPVDGILQNSKNAQTRGDNTVNIVNGDSTFNVLTCGVVPGQELRVKCSYGLDTTYSVGYFMADNSNAIISQYNAPSGSGYVYATVPEGATKIIVNGTSNLVPSVDIITNVEGYLPKVANPVCNLSLFEKFGVIGDSFASGELYYNGNYVDKYFISWGQIMARKHGTTCTNYSSGGLTTRTWLTAPRGKALLESSQPENIYYLALGINDVYALGTAYLGSLTDITSHSSPDDYGDTFYGNYGRIIELIKSHAPYAKIIMFTMAKEIGDYIPFNAAVKEIAEYYGIPYITQSDDAFFTSTVYTTMSGSHPTAIGYGGMADAFDRLINRCIENNIAYFFDAYMYD